MARVIDADALIMEWNKLAKRMARDGDGRIPVDFGLVICELSKTPTVDAVPVVRCRDCKYHEDTHVTGFEHCCLYGLTMRYNDFCSYGKREGGSDND